MTDYGTHTNPGRHPSQIGAAIFGAVYLLIGVLGFFVTGFDQWFGETNEFLLGFEINGLHNLVHIAIGALGLSMMGSVSSAKAFGWLLAAVYGLTFLYGLFAVGSENLNILSLNAADNGLHLISAIGGFIIAMWPARDRVADHRAREREVRIPDVERTHR